MNSSEIKSAHVEMASHLSCGKRLLKTRFLKFGTVGFWGTFVNMGILYIAQEIIYRGIARPDLCFNLSLGTAIFFATSHNFIWNRSWTWKDRNGRTQTSIVVQFMQYCAACWLAVALQFVFTNFLRQSMHYLPANFLAIGITAVLNYLINHVWTFRVRAGKAGAENRSCPK